MSAKISPAIVGAYLAIGLTAIYASRSDINLNKLTSVDVITTNISCSSLISSSLLQVPVDSELSSASSGALYFNTTTDSLYVKKSGEWDEVGGKIPIAETMPDLISGADEPVNITSLAASFTGTTRTCNSEATLLSALAACVDNDKVQLTSNITITTTPLTIPNTTILLDLNTYTLNVPAVTTFSIVCSQTGKSLLVQNGTINQTGTAGSSSSVFSNTNGFLYFNNVVINHGEVAISSTGSSSNRMILYCLNCTFHYIKLGQTANVYRIISIGGSVTDNSFVYIKNCTVETDANIDGGENLRGFIAFTTCPTNGSLTITNCNINPAHRMQSLVYMDSFPTTAVRNPYSIMFDHNTIGDAGVREQLLIMISGSTRRPLSNFDSIWFIENTINRADSNKGLFYIDTSSGYGGSTDVYIFKNTYPTLKSVDVIAGDTYASTLRKLVSKDGFVRGPTTLTSAYLQKYSVGF